jgi:hypothetical protein
MGQRMAQMGNGIFGAAFEAQHIAEIVEQADIVGRDLAHFFEILDRFVELTGGGEHGAEQETEIGALGRCFERSAQRLLGLGEAVLTHGFDNPILEVGHRHHVSVAVHRTPSKAMRPSPPLRKSLKFCREKW